MRKEGAEDKITREEGYQWTKIYVEKLCRDYTPFKMLVKDPILSVEDLISKIYITFLERSFFEKYDPKKSGKKFYIFQGVRNGLMDAVRTRREVPLRLCDKVRLKGTENPITLEDILECRKISPEKEALGVIYRDIILQYLYKESEERKGRRLPVVMKGHSPLLGYCSLDYKVIAQHLEVGYNLEEIASFFINQKTGDVVSIPKIWQDIKKMRNILEDSVYVAGV